MAPSGAVRPSSPKGLISSSPLHNFGAAERRQVWEAFSGPSPEATGPCCDWSGQLVETQPDPPIGCRLELMLGSKQILPFWGVAHEAMELWMAWNPKELHGLCAARR